MKKIIILIFALVFSLFLPSAFAFSQAETLEYYDKNYYTQEVPANTLEYIVGQSTNNYIDFEKIDPNYMDVYINNILVFSELTYVQNEFFSQITYEQNNLYLGGIQNGTLGVYRLGIDSVGDVNFQTRNEYVTTLNYTFVDKSKIVLPPTFAESIFLNITDIIVGFGSLLGALFVLIASIFYNDSLTIVGILSLLGIGLSFTYWGFRTILRLLKIKRE